MPYLFAQSLAGAFVVGSMAQIHHLSAIYLICLLLSFSIERVFFPGTERTQRSIPHDDRGASIAICDSLRGSDRGSKPLIRAIEREYLRSWEGWCPAAELNHRHTDFQPAEITLKPFERGVAAHLNVNPRIARYFPQPLRNASKGVRYQLRRSAARPTPTDRSLSMKPPLIRLLATASLPTALK